ncbi:MAG: hypothetical protein GY765_16475, partial [bacterium]|nr:hypothetical protein [bacterium]
WTVGSSQTITWNSGGTVGNVSLAYSVNNGSNWTTITSSTSNDGSFTWSVADAVSSQCLIRVSESDGNPLDVSNSVFSIVAQPTLTVTAPNGGQTWDAGSSQTITWTGSGVDNITIEYSTAGINGTYLTIAENISNTGSYQWDIPTTDSPQCLVRVRDAQSGTSDTSDTSFTIRLAASISITSPNGGEMWKLGTAQTLTWESNDSVGDIDIRLYNGDSPVLDIATVPVDSGSFTWDIPADFTAGENYRVRISQLSSGLDDYSDSYFSIIPSYNVSPDFNGDGIADIFWHYSGIGGFNTLWLRGMDTNSLPVVDAGDASGAVEIEAEPDHDWKPSGSGDFNGDGNTDLLWRNYSDGRNVVWLMDGVTRTAIVELQAEPDVAWTLCGTGDFNGDDKLDLVWRNLASGLNTIWFMDGVTYLGSQGVRSNRNMTWELCGTGDFDGDGNTDLVWRNLDDGRNAVWRMTGTRMTGVVWLDPERDLDWSLVGTADYNSDGHIDILWRNQTDGSNAIWYMDGSTTIGTESIPTVTDTDWKIEK